MRLYTCLIIVAAMMLPAVAETRERSAYKLVWADEFNKDGAPDPANWIHEKGFVRNNELQYYTGKPQNAFIEDGKLVIQALKEDYRVYVPVKKEDQRFYLLEDFDHACLHL